MKQEKLEKLIKGLGFVNLAERKTDPPIYSQNKDIMEPETFCINFQGRSYYREYAPLYNTLSLYIL